MRWVSLLHSHIYIYFSKIYRLTDKQKTNCTFSISLIGCNVPRTKSFHISQFFMYSFLKIASCSLPLQNSVDSFLIAERFQVCHITERCMICSSFVEFIFHFSRTVEPFYTPPLLEEFLWKRELNCRRCLPLEYITGPRKLVCSVFTLSCSCYELSSKTLAFPFRSPYLG